MLLCSEDLVSLNNFGFSHIHVVHEAVDYKIQRYLLRNVC